MLDPLPNYIPLVFGLTSILTLIIFFRAISTSAVHDTRTKATLILIGLIAWMLIQCLLALNDFYSNDTRAVPPRFLLAVVPPILTILFLFITKSGRRFIDSLPLATITWLSIVRIPVEFVLYWLSLYKAVPELMTFTGRNFDILAGITAPFVAYFGISLKKMNPRFILLWNIVSLGLLLNIVINAVLSAPFAIQQFAFDQPNIAILYFPFILLPAFIVPVVLFTHLVSIRQLLKK